MRVSGYRASACTKDIYVSSQLTRLRAKVKWTEWKGKLTLQNTAILRVRPVKDVIPPFPSPTISTQQSRGTTFGIAERNEDRYLCSGTTLLRISGQFHDSITKDKYRHLTRERSTATKVVVSNSNVAKRCKIKIRVKRQYT